MSPPRHSDQAPLRRAGAFALTRQLGQGGMGEVWLGQHTTRGTLAAVKIIRPEHTASADYQYAFKLEVQAVARLDHPSICRVLDYGQQATGPQERASWLAMSYYEGGSLEARQGMVRSWAQLKSCLLQLLDALAHAHARGTIHRDLKPGNVLLQREPGGLRYVLTDFGLAHPTSRHLSKRTQAFFTQSVGTPYYMPPEQIEGRWRDFGPWTDLYALGCMAYELASGAPPFQGRSAIEVIHQHLRAQAPPLAARFHAPPGLGAWIERMMARDTTARFERAADALWALLRLEPRAAAYDLTDLTTLHEASSEITIDRDEHDEAPSPITLRLPSGQVRALLAQDRGATPEPTPDTRADDTRADDTRADTREPAAQALASASRGALERAPIPESWRLTGASAQDAALLDVGLGLFSLREIPFVGRQRERDLLWEALRQVQRDGSPRLVLVRGASGTGKSRLVEWIGQRAEELGAASVLRIKHSPQQSAAQSVQEALLTLLRADDLDEAQLLERVFEFLRLRLPEHTDAQLTRLHAMALSTLCAPESAHRVSFASLRERQLALLPLLRAMASRRALIIWLDDVQWGVEHLEFAAAMLNAPRALSLPGLILATLRDEDPQAISALAPVLDRLDAHERVQTLRLGALPPQEHREFLRRLLPLEPALQEELAQRTEGNPLFAAQLVRDWVARDALIQGPSGFTRRPGAAAPLPDDVHELWQARVAALVAEGYLQASLGLELGAAWSGPAIPVLPWRAIMARHQAAPDLLEQMSQRGLIALHQDTWSFAHPMLRESMERVSRERRRWAQLHEAWAQHLRLTPELLRLGYHHQEAGHHDQAMQTLAQAAHHALDLSDYYGTLDALRRIERSADALGLAPASPERVALWPLAALALRYLGRVEDSNALIKRTLAHTPDDPPSGARADALRLMAGAQMLGQSAALAQGYIRRAIALYEDLGDTRGLIDALHTEGWAALNTQQDERARQAFERGALLGVTHDEPRRATWCEQGLVELSLRRLELRAAKDQAQRCLSAFEQLGSRAGMGTSLYNLAEIALYEGQAERAWRLAHESLQLLEHLGSSLRVHSHLLLGLMDLLSGAPEQTIARLKPWRASVSADDYYNMHVALELTLLAAHASRGDHAQVSTHLDAALATLYHRPVSLALYMLPTHALLSALTPQTPELRRALLLIEHLLKHLSPEPVRERFKREFAPELAALKPMT